MRPSIHEYFMVIALATAERATCSRRKVGCVLVDDQDHIISTGYNGVPSGAKHCTDAPCLGSGYGSGKGLALCEAIHAEVNAIAHCSNPKEIKIAYCTTLPCIHCIKILLATPCTHIYYSEDYPSSDSIKLWRKVGRKVERIEII